MVTNFDSMSISLDSHNQVKITFYNSHLTNNVVEYSSSGQRMIWDYSLGEYVPYGFSSSRNYLEESIQRSKRIAIDYALNNDFNYFFTQTFDKNKIDRNNAQLLYDRLKRSLSNYKQRYDFNFKYLIFPEFHKDKHIHFHGLIYLSPDNKDTIVLKWDKKSKCSYFQSQYFFKFGATRFDKINTNAFYTACYCSKYITKDTTRIFPSSYICSKGLKKSQRVSFDDASVYLTHKVLLNSVDGDLIKQFDSQFTSQFCFDVTMFRILFPEYSFLVGG